MAWALISAVSSGVIGGKSRGDFYAEPEQVEGRRAAVQPPLTAKERISIRARLVPDLRPDSTSSFRVAGPGPQLACSTPSP